MEEKRTDRKRCGWRAVLILFAFILFASVGSALLSNYGLMVTHYEASSAKLSAPVRIVHLTDLHNSEFVNGNVMTEYETKFVEMGKPINRLECKMK